MGQDTNTKAFHTIQLILWFALLMSQLIYLGVLFILTGQGAPEGSTMAPEELETMQMALGAVALSMVPAIFVMRHVMFGKPGQQGKLKERGRAKAALQVANLVSWSMAEAIAVFGFVLAFLSYDVTQFYPFLGLAMTLMFVLFPRTERQLDELPRDAF